MRIPTKEELTNLREKYPIGTRVELIKMDDFQSPPPGTLGTIKGVDDLGDLLMSWDSGGGLKLILGEDEFKVIG